MAACHRFAFCCALLSALPARAGELVILVPTATEMPMARFERYRLVDGMHRDLGLALADATGRQPRFVAVPRKRIAETLQSGQADVLCNFIPEWLNGKFSWTQPFLPMLEVVISDRAAQRPRTLADLSGQPIGTVLGYTYPELDAPLGKGFVREDSPSTEANMRKLAAGRLNHVVTLKGFVDYHLKLGHPALALHPPLVVRSFMGRCAVSPKGRVKLAEVERAVSRVVRDGTVAAILARYK
jgi:polar amino acid transport system substrate-binding protein